MRYRRGARGHVEFRLSDGFPARAIEGEVSLSCAADAVGLVVRYEDGFEGSNKCLVRFDAGPRLHARARARRALPRLDVVSWVSVFFCCDCVEPAARPIQGDVAFIGSLQIGSGHSALFTALLLVRRRHVCCVILARKRPGAD